MIITSHMSVTYDLWWTWWRHQMETFSALLAICAGNSPVPGEFPAQRPVTWSFDVFFDLRPNKWLSQQWWSWWFETPSCPLWLHRNDSEMGQWTEVAVSPVRVSECMPNNSLVETSLFSFVHYNDVIMTTVACQITSFTIVYSIVYSGANQRKHQSSASLAFVRGIHRDRWIPRTKASYAENVSIW